MLKAAILLAGLGYLWALSRGPQVLRYALKPGTMLLIIALAAQGLPGAGTYGQFVLAGLIFSVAGDIFLMLPGGFLKGLIAFFIAHLLYIAAFSPGLSFGVSDVETLAFLAAVAWPVFRALRPGVMEQGGSRLLIAVGLYMTAISVMVWRALATAEPLIIAGAVLFYMSDAILAYNRFARSYPWANHAVMATYYGAQYCLAVSVISG